MNYTQQEIYDKLEAVQLLLTELQRQVGVVVIGLNEKDVLKSNGGIVQAYTDANRLALMLGKLEPIIRNHNEKLTKSVDCVDQMLDLLQVRLPSDDKFTGHADVRLRQDVYDKLVDLVRGVQG